MKSVPVVGVQKEVLRWARKTIGLSISDVALRLKCLDEEVEFWENGDAAPSYVQLEKLAYQIYKRPLAVFFLPKPPDEQLPEHEFRTLPQEDMRTLIADTYMQIRRAHAFQLALEELFDEQTPLARFIPKDIYLSREKSIPEQAKTIRDYLGITLDQQTSWKNDEIALKMWREVVENSGIFVFKAPFKQKDISGFCLRDERFPLIYINNSTSKTRQVFSLLHELAHLLLNINGLSKLDQSYVERLPNEERKIERFCNAVSAEVLLPIEDFLIQSRHFPDNVEQATESMFSQLALHYGVSREAVLRRFLDQGRVGAEFYSQKAKMWAAQKKPSKGGDWYASQNVYLSDRFAKEVVSRHYRHQISIEHASELLGIKAKNFAGLEQRILQGSAA
jgi:Zn-dependent peptidase ImmA (M78 family)/transcriptional regulator with XRE-family HTH domain